MKKKASKDPDEGKEGTADEIPIPRKMEAHCKERKPAPTALLASQLGWQGTFAPRKIQNARRILPLHIVSRSPGCSFPWA